MTRDRIGEVLLQFPSNEEKPSYERKEQFALKDWQKRLRLLVIETKVGIGWLAYWAADSKLSNNKPSDNKLSENNLARKLVENMGIFFNQSHM